MTDLSDNSPSPKPVSNTLADETIGSPPEKITLALNGSEVAPAEKHWETTPATRPDLLTSPPHFSELSNASGPEPTLTTDTTVKNFIAEAIAGAITDLKKDLLAALGHKRKAMKDIVTDSEDSDIEENSQQSSEATPVYNRSPLAPSKRRRELLYDSDQISLTSSNGGNSPRPSRRTAEAVMGAVQVFPREINKFNGLTNIDYFITDLKSAFLSPGAEKVPEAEKVCYAARFLEGDARTWFQSYARDQETNPIYKDSNLFLEELRNTFSTDDRLNSALERFQGLKYDKTKKIPLVIADFKCLMLDLKNEIGQTVAIRAFLTTLSQTVNDQIRMLSNGGTITSLEEAYQLAVRATNIVAMTVQKEPNAPTTEYPTSSRPRESYKRTNDKHSSPEITKCTKCQGNYHTADNCKLTPEQLLLFCTHCARAGHTLPDCRNYARMKAKDNGKIKAKIMKTTDTRSFNYAIRLGLKLGKCSLVPVKQCLELEVILHQPDGKENYKLRTLVDSGASATFINSELVNKLQLPTEKLETALDVELADGTTSKTGSITMIIKPCKIDIGQTHSEVIAPYVTAIPEWDLILGYSWLRQHNPVIDWQDSEIHFSDIKDVVKQIVNGTLSHDKQHGANESRNAQSITLYICI